MNDFANIKRNKSNSWDMRLSFTIVATDNEWTVMPSITGWTEGQPSNDSLAESKYGEVRVTYSGTIAEGGGGLVKDHVDVEMVPGGRIAPIPYTWFAGVNGLGERFGTDWDSVAYMATGKKDTAGNALAVWRDYVAGNGSNGCEGCFPCDDPHGERHADHPLVPCAQRHGIEQGRADRGTYVPRDGRTCARRRMDGSVARL